MIIRVKPVIINVKMRNKWLIIIIIIIVIIIIIIITTPAISSGPDLHTRRSPT
jgi:ABC-type cobalt transport system substrate-binding protein